MKYRNPILCAALSSLSIMLSLAAHAGQAPLRVCADPNYLPYSNRAGQGFENKVAQIIANGMDRKLEYHWASYRGHGGFSNFLAENLDAHKCDVIMNLPFGDPEERATKPYYTSSYVFIYKKAKHYHLRSMNSVSLRSIKIGFEAGTAPETALKILGLTHNAVAFHIAGNPDASPKIMLQAVQDGKVGTMITWEPIIGDFLKEYPDLKVVKVPSEEYGPGLPAVRYTFAMSMGVRKHDKALRDKLDKVIASEKPKIDAVLTKYNVRLYPGRENINQTH